MDIEINTNVSNIDVEVEKAGPQGLSAYQVAVKNGFVGTEQEWLDSLVGEKGEKGDTGNTGATGEPGRDGYVQYTAGDNITIENNVISATGGDLSNYYTKSEVDDGLNTRSFVLKINDSYGGYSHTVNDADNLSSASKFINDIYSYAISTGEKSVSVKITNTAAVWAVFNKSIYWNHNNTDFATQRTQYTFDGMYVDNYMYAFGISSFRFVPEEVRIYGTWADNVFTATRIEWEINANNYFSPNDYPKTNTVLTKTNTTSYIPASDYNPATKKYVDDAIASAITTTLGGSF